jgi:hypothetical protein
VQLLLKYGPIIDAKTYKTIYECLVAGDPKQRTLRSIITTINGHYAKIAKGENNGK